VGKLESYRRPRLHCERLPRRGWTPPPGQWSEPVWWGDRRRQIRQSSWLGSFDSDESCCRRRKSTAVSAASTSLFVCIRVLSLALQVSGLHSCLPPYSWKCYTPKPLKCFVPPFRPFLIAFFSWVWSCKQYITSLRKQLHSLMQMRGPHSTPASKLLQLP